MEHQQVTASRRPPQRISWPGYLVAVAAIAGLTTAALPLREHFLPPNLIMVYLLAVSLVARYFHRGPAILASILAVAAFDFFFIKPHLTFAVDDVQYLLTFAIMLLVGIWISGLTGLLEEQTEARVLSQAQVANEQLRNSLLTSISHDLRTPLAGISGAATTLLSLPNAAAAEAGPTLLSTIRDETDRLALLVNNILDMTRLESGAVELRLEWLPLEEPIGAALTALGSRMAGRAVKVNLSPEVPLIKADAVLLERLFANLLDNAAKHSPIEMPIEIAAEWAASAAVVKVMDRGAGLPAADIADLFRKFGRVGPMDGTSRPASRGSGLGLSICMAIVGAHGGTITAGNRTGGGAVFEFTLPQTEQPPHVPAEALVERGTA
jgi:two-component system sensor histidine kinase KdpD